MSTTVSRPTYDCQLLVDDIAAKGLTNSSLAARAGVSDMTITRLVRGDPVRPPYAKKVARALGYPLRRYLRSRQPLTRRGVTA